MPSAFDSAKRGLAEVMPYSALFSAGFSLLSAVFSGMLFIYTQVRGTQVKLLLPDEIAVLVPDDGSDVASVLLSAGFKCTGLDKSLGSVQRVTADLSSAAGTDHWIYRWAMEVKFVATSSQPNGRPSADEVQYVSRVTQFVIPAQSSVVKLIEFWPTGKLMPSSMLTGNLKLRMAIESDNGTVRSGEREYACGHLERGIFSWCYQT
jgi:hypothetical protein